MKQRRSVDSPASHLFAGKLESNSDRDVLSQDAFHKVISLERRRTERSRKPFLLMLLDLGENPGTAAMHKNVRNLLSALAASTRETDIVGWYQLKQVMGVMFTEIGAEDRETIVNTMTARLTEILRSRLTLNQLRVSFHLYPEDWRQDAPKRPSNPALYPDLNARDDNKRVSNSMKRAMDIAGSLMALILGAPVFLAIAVAIKATSKGPIFFRQQRIGRHGVPFMFLKFRSMYVGNDATIHKEYVTQLINGKAKRHASEGNGEGVFKLTRDPRITRVGGFLRRTSLDELPQFVNVLRGDMSLVGPRPPVPYEVEAYDLWHRRRLLEAKPGITGLWQVTGRSKVTFDEMVRLDLHYARTWSPWMDVKILLRTPGAVVQGGGAH